MPQPTQSIDDLLAQFRALGGEARLDGASLRLSDDAYSGGLDLMEELRSRRSEVVGLLARSRPRRPLPPIRRTPAAGKVGVASAQEPWVDVNRAPLHEQWLPVVWKMEGKLDRESFRRSFLDLLQVHELLRARYVGGHEHPELIVGKIDEARLPFADLTPLPVDQRAIAIWKRLKPVYQKISSLEDGVLKLWLFRTDDERHFLAGFLHHIAFDKRSQQVFFGELMGRYYGHLLGRPAPKVAALQYSDFVRWEQQWLTPTERAVATAYWESLLSMTPPMRLPGSGDRGLSSSIGALSFAISKDLSSSSEGFARTMGVTTNIFVLTVLSIALGEWARRNDVLLGCHVHARPPACDSVIGCFAQARPFHLSFADNPSFRTLLQRARTSLAAASDLRRPISPDLADRSEFGRILFNFTDRRPRPAASLAVKPTDGSQTFNMVRPVDVGALADVSDQPGRLKAGMSYLPRRLQTDFCRDLHVGVEQTGEGLTGRITFAANCFPHDTVAAVASRLAGLMRALMQTPNDGVLDIRARIPAAVRAEAASEQNAPQ